MNPSKNISQLGIVILRFSKALGERARDLKPVLGWAISSILLYIQFFINYIFPFKEKSLKGEVILITGSAGGLGQEVCKQLAMSGAKLVLWDISTEETAQSLRDLGAECVFEDTVDISDRHQIATAAERVRENVGQVTILINNAAVAPINNFLDLDPVAVKRTFEVNVLSQFWTIQEFLPHMIAKDYGQIVTIISVTAFMQMVGCSPYVSSKHAVHGLIESLKDELTSAGCNNVKFTSVYPFFIQTNMIMERGLKINFKYPWITPFLRASNVAEKIIEGIRRESEFVYIPKHFQLYLSLKPFVPSRIHHLTVNFLTDVLLPPVVPMSPEVMNTKGIETESENFSENDVLFKEPSPETDPLVASVATLRRVV